VIVKDANELRESVKRVLLAAGADEENAHLVAVHLVKADLSGVQTHGILQVAKYVEWIEKGYIDPAGRPHIIDDHPTWAKVDGGATFGHVAADYATRLAIEKAKEQTIAMVGIVHVNHIGRLGHFSEIAAAEGMISLIWDGGINHISPRAAPFGGCERILDVDPIAIGIPAGDRDPVIVDFATTSGSAVKVDNAQRRGRMLPPGTIVDKLGRPSIDPRDYFEGGALAPFGGHKGYALMLATQFLGRVLTGADNHIRNGEVLPEMRHQGVTIIVIRADAFGPMDEFCGRVDETLNRLTTSRPGEGFGSVRYAGQIESTRRAEGEDSGIPYLDDVWQMFADAAKSVGVAV